jgi:NADPH-dependent 2,4-dienoyl-CoA reductase/sulfur reductase-like enzyme
MVVLSRKIGTYSSLKQDREDSKPSKMANDLAKLQLSVSEEPAARLLKKKRVCIVGAGVAGMRCDVTVLEVRDRVGGRLTQVQLNGHLIDL